MKWFSLVTNHEEGRSQIKEQDKNGNDIKILTIHEGKKIVSAATLNGLVSLLIDESNSGLLIHYLFHYFISLFIYLFQIRFELW